MGFVLLVIVCYFISKALCQELYIGCYRTFSELSSEKKLVQSASECVARCKPKINLFSALKNGSSCYCGNITNTRVPSSICNIPCSDNNGTCGGRDFYAIYTGVPTYLGCYVDVNDDRDLANWTLGGYDHKYFLTINQCYQICSPNYSFMGVQFSYACFCGQQYGKHGKAKESECNKTCTGNTNQICGGACRNNIYAVEHLPGLNKKYSQVFHCLNGTTDMYGTCINKTCQQGWKGTKCNQRDCSTNYGNCGVHSCEETKFGNQTISECVCNTGFQSISIYEECIDVNECDSNICNNSSQICLNNPGSFYCISDEVAFFLTVDKNVVWYFLNGAIGLVADMKVVTGFITLLSLLSFVSIIFVSIAFFYKTLCQEVYIGCYRNFAGLSFSLNSVQSVSQCLGECKSQTSLFAAVKDGSSCYCGNITNTRVPSSNCNLPCSDNIGTCGGRDYYAVYTDIQTYYGCFKDEYSPRDMAFHAANLSNDMMTIDKCYKLCFAVGNRFMGVQYTDHCFCGQHYGKYGRAPESECYMKCNGDENQICGGGYRNSVYSVGYIDGLNKSYSEVFHCYGGLISRTGACLSNSCQFGWKGSKCSQRDCTINNGNCGDQKCEETKISNQLISECVCNAGFQSVSIYDRCTDEDECQSNPCNETSETCVNTIGSFKCICSPGYIYFNQSGCEAQCIKNFEDRRCMNPEARDEDKRISVLATFMALALCVIITFAIALICYKYKVRELKSMLKALQSNDDANDPYNLLGNSIKVPDDHNYSDLEMHG